MRKLKYAITVILVLFVASALFLKCGSGGGSGPSSVTVTMNGSIDFGGGTEIDYEDIAIGFGDNETLVDSSGEFDIKGTKDVPGLMIALDETDSIPVFLAVVPDPDNSLDVNLDAQSTALALVFLTPYVCVPMRRTPRL